MSPRHRSSAPDSAQHHRDWLALVEVTGPFLSLPVLRATWPSLDAIEPAERDELRRAHNAWRDDPAAGQRAWIEYVLRDLLGWRELLRFGGLEALAVAVPEHDTTLAPSFALVEPDDDAPEVKPAAARLLGLVCPPGTQPTARLRDSAWAATPVDRLAQLCRHHEVPLGLATDGRWWALVWAPRGGVTTTAVFDAVGWPEATDRHVVRAFLSLLGRKRFFGVKEPEQLLALLKESEGKQEEITDALGVQVRQAVELLVAAFGRADVRERAAGGTGLTGVDAHDVYRAAVSVMMRVVFLLFAEERRLLPSDNELYASAYSASRLGAELEQRAREGSEDELENSHAAWHRLRALFAAVYSGIDHPRLRMHAHDGSLFDPDAYPWLPDAVDDRTVLHMLKAVQHVEIGTGTNRERRTLSFRQLDVEQIGYVYEGLLSFEGFRADGVVVGLVGKQGYEEEVPLTELEAIAGDDMAAVLADRYKSSGIGSVRALERRLAPLDPAATEDARKKLLAVTDGDYPLTERLLPFYGLLRPDLRDLPVVILPGALYVTESKLRKNTGTHYTPRDLAEKVVKHALEPLLYHEGPVQTSDRERWRATAKSSDELLQLKVADIAMGSAAFLVAAARYLGDALLSALAREGSVERSLPDETAPLSADEDPQVIDARRLVIEHCLYGVDINPMAVEMAKLSLWLVSMDPKRPFTFLDDRLVAGDSLLGITSLEQLEYLHMDPMKGRELHQDLFDWTAGVRSQVGRIADLRREIAAIEPGDDPIAALDHKRALLEEAHLESGRLRLYADLAVGAALSHAGKGANGLDVGSLAAARIVNDLAAGRGEVESRQQRRDWLCFDQPSDSFDREPLHWPLVFPEVFADRGFDAIVGNPPFLHGQKISGSLGVSFRRYLVDSIADGARGSADLVAYFVLRAHALLGASGQSGLIATNTLAQGDTREVCLDRLLAVGLEIRRSVKSEPWPSKSAAVEYCAIWTSRQQLGKDAERFADDTRVSQISSSLDPVSGSSFTARRLLENRGIAFQGVIILGTGFTLSPDDAHRLIVSEPIYADVLFPYMSGRDLNVSPTLDVSRWVINFQNMSEERARGYPVCYEQVVQRVKEERLRQKDAGGKTFWWQFLRQRPEFKKASSGLSKIIAITIHTSTVIPVLVPNDRIYSNGLVLFATDDRSVLAVLSGAAHYWWVRTYASSLKSDLRYSPSDVFETFPMPTSTMELAELGETLEICRRNVMLSRQAGLTNTYNLVFDSSVSDDDIIELRRIHREIDLATVRAYGWDDLLEQLDHGFHPAGRDLRYTIGPAAQREILGRLLELNRARYAEEAKQGLHDKKGRRTKALASTNQALF